MKLLRLTLFLGIFLICVVVNAAELSDVLTTFAKTLTIDNPYIWALSLLIELFCRFKKTDKPKGIIHTIAVTARAGARVLSGLAEVSDKIIPQRLK